MKITLAALAAPTAPAAASQVVHAAPASPLVGHRLIVHPVDVAGQQLTGTYEVCVPV
jgi:hypothetical protein